MRDRWIVLGSLLMALGVIAGAFGAHGLRGRVTPRDLEVFETAVRYHLLHGLGLLLVGVLRRQLAEVDIELPARLLFGGTVVFSGSLYLLVLTGPRWLGAITPLGGTALILGWLLLAARVARTP